MSSRKPDRMKRRSRAPIPFVCPECRTELRRPRRPGGPSRPLACPGCGGSFPVLEGIPRFVPNSNYADSFAFQWNKYARTQIDRFSGLALSEERFFKVSGWPRDLAGQTILEAGCGAGRFTSIALQTGATVYSFDFSRAVDANRINNGPHARLHLFQGDIYRIPLPHGAFDRIFCFGVLQHCPDPEKAFLSLVPFLKPGGEIAIDVYQITPRIIVTPKYWLRPLARRMDKQALHRLVERIVPPLIPIKARIRRIPLAGRYIAYFIPIACYKDILPLSDEKIVEWGILDTFDMLSPEYDKPQTLRAVRRWFEKSDLERVEVKYGPNGINGTGISKGEIACREQN